MIKCSNPDCGVENSDESKFCRACGKPLKHEASALKKIMYVINAFFIATFLYCLFSYSSPESKVRSWDDRYYGKAYYVFYTPSFDLFTISKSTGFCSGSYEDESYEVASEKALDNYHNNVIMWAGIFGLLALVSCSLTRKIS